MSVAAVKSQPSQRSTIDGMVAACRALVGDEVLPWVAEWDRDDVLPSAVMRELADIGVPGALVPRNYGGPGLSVAAITAPLRILAQGWISLTGAVNTTHLATALLLRHGTEQQREQWLPQIATGTVWASFSITEPGAGSDLKRLTTSAEQTDDGLLITGEKRWIAGGLSFPLAFMLARVDGDTRPSCIVLPTSGRGTDTWSARAIDKLGYRGIESAAWRFDRHRAVAAEVLGGAEGREQGAQQMIDVLDIGRVNVACRALGVIDRAIECALSESTGRAVGAGILGDHTHAQLRLGEMRCRQRTVEASIEMAAHSIDAERLEAGELATAAKVAASEGALWAVESASRLAASRSYTADCELARLRRDAPQTQIGEGANDALLLAMGRSLIRERTSLRHTQADAQTARGDAAMRASSPEHEWPPTGSSARWQLT